MCGRYALDLAPEDLRRQLQSYGLTVQRLVDDNDAIESLNIAPTAHCAIYCQEDSELEIRYMKWGLVPGFAKQPMKLSLFNTKAESLEHLKPIWSCAKYRRGIVVMQGYYEWHKVGKDRIPYYFKNKNNQLLCVLGIWDVNDHMDNGLHTFSIVTTSAAKRLRKIHERMPAIVSIEQATKWIQGEWPDVLELIESQNDLEFYRVGSEVNKVGAKGPLNKPLKVMEAWVKQEAETKTEKESPGEPTKEDSEDEEVKVEPKVKEEGSEDKQAKVEPKEEPQTRARKRTKEPKEPSKRKRTQKSVKEFF